MEASQARRTTLVYVHTIDAPAARVFPLLCPTREYEWIDGWSCEMVYSDSGVAENNCIFKTRLPGEGERIWVVSTYEPDAHRIGFVVHEAPSLMLKLDISLTECDDGSTHAQWTRTFTGLNEAGNRFIDAELAAQHEMRMRFLDASLNHFCKTGQLLNMEAWVAAQHALHA